MSRQKFNLSFPSYEESLYQFLLEQDNGSALIRKLLTLYKLGLINIDGLNAGTTPSPSIIKPAKIVSEPVVEIVEGFNEVVTNSENVNFLKGFNANLEDY